MKIMIFHRFVIDFFMNLEAKGTSRGADLAFQTSKYSISELRWSCGTVRSIDKLANAYRSRLEPFPEVLEIIRSR